jgi:hypothetical protein
MALKKMALEETILDFYKKFKKVVNRLGFADFFCFFFEFYKHKELDTYRVGP